MGFGDVMYKYHVYVSIWSEVVPNPMLRMVKFRVGPNFYSREFEHQLVVVYDT